MCFLLIWGRFFIVLGTFWLIVDPFGPMWGASGPKWSTRPPKVSVWTIGPEPFGSHVGIFFVFFAVLFSSHFLETLRNPKLPKISAKGFQNGSQNSSQITLLGDLPEVSWICYLLYGSHMGLSRDAPGRHPKSSPIPEPLPNPIFLHFKRIWGSIWEPFWHNFS